ncbi:hypothetical protein EG849_08795 [Flavobacterium macacae]|uniref:Uncharacterized protein n=2 Tax=Flavobacterium macacae TaxID=2488993 RepID=A0A3P3WBP9_9FLAO|nr:hypothetical protein EG849_08795 [Flavobacterium macacae]
MNDEDFIRKATDRVKRHAAPIKKMSPDKIRTHKRKAADRPKGHAAPITKKKLKPFELELIKERRRIDQRDTPLL